MTDSIMQLRQEIANFVSDRGLDEFRSPKNLVMALSVEVAEPHFGGKWKADRELP